MAYNTCLAVAHNDTELSEHTHTHVRMMCARIIMTVDNCVVRLFALCAAAVATGQKVFVRHRPAVVVIYVICVHLCVFSCERTLSRDATASQSQRNSREMRTKNCVNVCVRCLHGVVIRMRSFHVRAVHWIVSRNSEIPDESVAVYAKRTVVRLSLLSRQKRQRKIPTSDHPVANFAGPPTRFVWNCRKTLTALVLRYPFSRIPVFDANTNTYVAQSMHRLSIRQDYVFI